jgi:hypothetical protein
VCRWGFQCAPCDMLRMIVTIDYKQYTAEALRLSQAHGFCS